ncbi:hypothetical protein DEO72_LG11g1550 [Vigna unguiculata]|uniref:Uncharacterized protein n=1 Tax=Vigna unguiculata TaxID=3917 RepID=A0A4D6NRY8_VIGUN|nr:hypothetical protein DEO72_LG11g1550 [Vigna unguiculata]
MEAAVAVADVKQWCRLDARMVRHFRHGEAQWRCSNVNGGRNARCRNVAGSRWCCVAGPDGARGSFAEAW